MAELPKVYDPKAVEKAVYGRWMAAGAFNAEPDAPGKKYCIVIPPPNVTAALHLGHALNNTLQDVLVRARRMQGFNALWMPGTDHAGIATQTVVEKRILAEEGKRRTELDPDPAVARQKFVARTQAWKDEYEARILDQLQKMGCSCDWRRTRFTMDDQCAKAVRAAFFKLFSDELIYRGKRLVNWDPATQTVLADDEVEHEKVNGHFWYLRYPLVEPVALPSGTGSGTGILPVSPAGILPAEVVTIDKRYGAYLPHWTKVGSTYAVTFRLADSLPAAVLDAWVKAREEIELRAKQQGRDLTYQERKELHVLHSTRIDSYLNQGHGECLLRDARIAELVQNALKHFDRDRYELVAWAIMPNHVHVIVTPMGSHGLPDILHSWKSFTATQANKLLGRQGKPFWQAEYYDHLIRDEDDFIHCVNYVLDNPAKAGLEDWKWFGSQKQEQGQDAPATHGQDARATAITHITVATTRPETMLGDTAVAMNPSDPRAKYLVGRKVRLPIVGRIIPIITDEHVVLPNPEGEDDKARFGTGFLKVTPAHDPDDYAIRERHNAAHADATIDIINVLAPDGTISNKHGWTDWDAIRNGDVEKLIGLDRFDAREKVVEFFRAKGLLENVRDYVHEVGHSYRSHVPIEPYLSDQWYVAVKKSIPGVEPAMARCRLNDDQVETRGNAVYIKGTDVPVDSLAGLALMPLLDGRLRFIPDRYANNYRNWLENLRDWPISRQLWWGHRIPVWSFQPDFYGSYQYRDIAADGGARYVKELTTRLNELAETEGLKAKLPFFVRGETDTWRFWICTLGEDADLLLTRLADLAKVLVARPLVPGQQVPTIRNVGFASTDSWTRASELIRMMTNLARDEDVLDTWFSSALWPFSTMGWPAKTAEMKAWYPGDVLCTAREIITLWVSRMVMMGQYCADDIPFSDVFIHAMIQDGEGQKMSKSLGNGVDPVDIIDSHGADAMRFTLVYMTTQTQDVRMPVELICPHHGETFDPKMITDKAGNRVAAPIQSCPAHPKMKMVSPYGVASGEAQPTPEMPLARTTSIKFDIGRNFANKLWNASRFAMMNLAGMPAWGERGGERGTGILPVSPAGILPAKLTDKQGQDGPATHGQDAHATHGQDAHATHGQDAHATHGQDARATLADKWILSRLAATIRDATAAIDGYRFNELADTLYHFVWDDFCDWYLEIAKGRINAGEAGPKAVLAHCLDTTLRLLHPIMPFVTEAIWQNLNAVAPSRGPSNEPAEPMLIRARWPVADSAAIDQAAERDFDMLRDLVRGIRNSRTEHAVPPGRKVKVIVEAAGRAGEVLLKDHANIEMMKSQAGLDEVRLVAVGTIAPALVRNAAAVASGGVQAYVLDIIDRDAELARLTRQRDTLARGIKSIEGKLSNEGFLKKAPPELAAKERARMEGLKADLAAVEKALDALK